MKFVNHIVNDTLLTHPNWTKIEIDQVDTQKSVIKNFVNLDLSTNLPKIEIEFPLEWTQLPEVLVQLGFLPILHSFFLNTNQNILSNDILPKEIPKFSKLLPLLHQQADYHHQLYPDYYKSSQNVDWAEYEIVLQSELSTPDSIHFFIEDNDQIIGFIQGQYNRKYAIIWELIIDEQFRQKGYGHKLLIQFISQAISLGIDTIEVETGHNQPSQKIYLNAGFIPKNQSWYRLSDPT